MTTPVRILILADHKLLRAGLTSVLRTYDDLQVVGEAADEAELQSFLSQNQLPEVILMDTGTGSNSGTTLARWLTRHYPAARVVGLALSGAQPDLMELVQAGARGFLLKDTGPEDLHHAVRKVAGGSTYFASPVAESLLDSILNKNVTRPETAPEANAAQKPVRLTRREIDILVLVAKEHTSNQIADKLNISARTVENHRYRLMQKLGVKGAAGLAKYAIRHGILKESAF